MKTFWHKLSDFFETGDLVPFAVVISVYHYWKALGAAGDEWYVAIAVAVFVDLLHFRTVRRAVQVRSRMAWATAMLTTLMAVGYHIKFYSLNVDDPLMVLLYALPIPIGIAILAWQQESLQGQSVRTFWHKRIKRVLGLARQAQRASKELQIENKRLQERLKAVQTEAERQQKDAGRMQEIAKAWQTMNAEAQALAKLNAGMLSAEQAAALIGVKDVRTVQSRAEKLNGVAR